MTDSDSFQTGISDFSTPGTELGGLELGVKNIVSEYESRANTFPLDSEELNFNRLIDYRKQYGYGGNFESLAGRLNNKLHATSYTAKVESGFSIRKLKEIINEDKVSLPLVELHIDYYDNIDAYDVQPGQFGESEIPSVIGALITNGEVWYWDPIYDYRYSDKPGNKELRMSESMFLELWSRKNSARWTFWIDRQDQETLPIFEGDNDD